MNRRSSESESDSPEDAVKEIGKRLGGLEVGNAWDDRPDPKGETNWVVGYSAPPKSLRFIDHDLSGHTPYQVQDVALKYFVHVPSESGKWGQGKPVDRKKSKGRRTLTVMVTKGEFKLTFSKKGKRYSVIFDKPGDYVIFGPGFAHSWKTIKRSTILTMRWQVLRKE